MHQHQFRRVMPASLLMIIAIATFAFAWWQPAGAADQTACHDASLARQRTEVDADMTVPQFDPSLGTLLEVTVPTQQVHLDTDAKFENTAATSVQFAEQMTYQVTFSSPAGLASPPVVSGTIQRVSTQTLAAFDGTLDYAGPSAVTQPSTLRDANASSVASTAPGTLAAFTGNGSLSFHVATLIGEQFTGGGGNVQFVINTFAAASVQVCYRYAPPAPTTTTTSPAPTTTTPATPTTTTPVEVKAARVERAVPAAPHFTG